VTDSLADQLTSRILGPRDLADVVGLVEASDVAVLGQRDFTEQEVAADLVRAGTEHSGWYDGTGTLVGYGWVHRIEDSEAVEIDVYVRPTHDVSLGDVVVAWAVDRGRAMAAAAGHAEARLDAYSYRQDERTRGWLTRAGFEVGTAFTRMRIDFDGPVEVPAATRVTVRPADTEDDHRLAHRISTEAFSDHYGHVDVSFETFERRLTENGEDWTSLMLAELDGEPLGVLVASRQFEEDEDAGYVRTLGVLSAGRGHGVAKALLRTYFDQSQRAGRSAVLLHVDVANVTGALRLYESVGMRTVLEIDAWSTRTPSLDADTPL
jgi:mycothiol synthase